MANIKISELEEYTQAKDNDLLVIVDTTNNETKKIKNFNLSKNKLDKTSIKNIKTDSDGNIYSCNYVNTTIGSLEDLETTDKTNIVNAINGVVESGSNDNGSYVKYADGTIIEYGNGDCSLDPNSYRDVIFTLPVKTVSTIWANVTMQSASESPTMGSITFAVNTFDTTSITVRAFNNTNDGRGPFVYWIVIGRWK